MPESSNATNEKQPPIFGRRTFIKSVLADVAGAALYFGLKPKSLSDEPELVPPPAQHSAQDLSDAPSVNTGDEKKFEPIPLEPLDPNAILTDEQLERYHITISQGAETRLHLKAGVFDFEVFKDVVDGKTGGIEIALVDALNMNPLKGINFSPAARAVFDLYYGPQNARSIVRQNLNFNKALLERKKEYQPLNSEDGFNAIIDANKLENHIRVQEEALAGSDSEFNRYFSNDYTLPHGSTQASGFFVSSDLLNTEEWAKNLPQKYKDKNYFFMSVGEWYVPHPENSYPDPTILDDSRIPEIARSDPNAYLFRSTVDSASKVPSFVIRHELSHYPKNSERMADQEAYDSLRNAWIRYQFGDESGYCFVFENKYGITTAANPTHPQEFNA